jgi:hypothetical protein
MQCTININIDSAGLQKIYGAGQYVTLVKSVQSMVEIPRPAGSGVTIAWITFKPFEKNIVSWNDNYYIYATTSELMPGHLVTMNTLTDEPVQLGWTYTFRHGQFSPAAKGTANAFTVVDMMNGVFGFGLAQRATVNNASTITPLSAISSLFNQQIFISPAREMFIFLSSVGSSGSVLYVIPDNALTLPLTGRGLTATAGFNDQNNTFFWQD